LNIREIADEVGISRGSANMILTDDFNWHVKSGSKIYAQAAFARAVITTPWGRTEYNLETKVQSSVEASNIPEAQKSMTGSEQCEGDAVFFLRLWGYCASWVLITRPNCQ
jgi:hypothetical protein